MTGREVTAAETAIEAATADALDPLRYHRAHAHLHGAFPQDGFGRFAERVARAFGTPRFVLIQTLIVLAWIGLNVTAVVHHWDPYPFILLNLAFSTQAAYAAPFILLAGNRQAARDKAKEEADARHREETAAATRQLLEGIHLLLTENTTLTTATKETADAIAAAVECVEEVHRHVTALTEAAGVAAGARAPKPPRKRTSRAAEKPATDH